MGVAPPFPAILGRGGEVAKIESPAAWKVVEVDRLPTLWARWVCIIENPVLIRRREVGVVPIDRHFLRADRLDPVGLVNKVIKAGGSAGGLRPHRDNFVVFPDEM